MRLTVDKILGMLPDLERQAAAKGTTLCLELRREQPRGPRRAHRQDGGRRNQCS